MRALLRGIQASFQVAGLRAYLLLRLPRDFNKVRDSGHNSVPNKMPTMHGENLDK